SLLRTFVVDNRIIFISVSCQSLLPLPGYSGEVLDSLELNEGSKAGPETSAELPFQTLTVEGVPFSVEMPGSPKDEPTTVGQGFGQMTLHRFKYERDLRKFLFAYAAVPSSEPPEG